MRTAIRVVLLLAVLALLGWLVEDFPKDHGGDALGIALCLVSLAIQFRGWRREIRNRNDRSNS